MLLSLLLLFVVLLCFGPRLGPLATLPAGIACSLDFAVEFDMALARPGNVQVLFFFNKVWFPSLRHRWCCGNTETIKQRRTETLKHVG